MATIVKLPESTIRLIAAGEIITKPVSVVKELLENSLDAGATNIRVIIDQGGLKLIEINDNGHGISNLNAELLCTRYATSKLLSANELEKICTFGFRGEALASISEVADVEVNTFNNIRDVQGWHANYKGGQLVGKVCDKSVSTRGTQIKVLNLFASMAGRLRALKTKINDEKKAIVEMIMRYAIHHRETVTISLKEPDSPDLVCVLAPMDLRSCVGMFFGMEIEQNLTESTTVLNDPYNYSFKMAFSEKKATSGHSSATNIIFINNRLVKCVDLQREVDALMRERLPKSIPFFYIDLTVPPNKIDVNTHPAKATVTLHSQETVIASIVAALQDDIDRHFKSKPLAQNDLPFNKTLEKIINLSQSTKASAGSPNIASQVNESRVALLAPASLTQTAEPKNWPQDSSTTTPMKVHAKIQPPSTLKRPQNLVHNDSTQQTLTQMIALKPSKPILNSNRTGVGEKILPLPGMDKDSHSSEGKLYSSSETEVGEPSPEKRSKRNLRLFSIHQLKQLVGREKASDQRTKIIKNSTFVGIFDHHRALIQHETELLAINFKAYLKEQYYQFYLFDFGNFPPIDILPPGNKIRYFIETYFDDIKKHDRRKYAEFKLNTAGAVMEKLLKHSAMFEDYLTLKFTDNEILTLPNIIPNQVPNMAFLGKFLAELANLVDYREERECLRVIGRLIADFYSEPPINLKNIKVHRRYHDVIETMLYSAIKSYLLIPEWLLSPDNIVKISDTRDLYKVFERC